jgi:hypothetical protein
VEGLRRFLEDEVLPWFETRKKELANRHLIREQAFGEALDPDKLERLGRYEVHLDRKLADGGYAAAPQRTPNPARVQLIRFANTAISMTALIASPVSTVRKGRMVNDSCQASEVARRLSLGGETQGR